MRVLLTSIGSYGDLNPYIGLGLALKARGHQPILAVTRGYCRAVEAAGLECRPVRPDGDPHDPAILARIMHPVFGAEYLVRRLLMPRVRETYDDLFVAARDAEAIVSHPLTFAAPLVAEKRGLPWAGAVLAPLSFFSNADPPLVVPSALLAACTTAGHARDPRLSAPEESSHARGANLFKNCAGRSACHEAAILSMRDSSRRA